MAKSIPGLYEKILSDPVVFPLVPIISDDLQDCIKRMLCKDPSKRITLPQLKVLRKTLCLNSTEINSNTGE